MVKNKTKKCILLILDGWGIAKPSRGNAITLAKTPTYNMIIKKYQNSKLIAHGIKVGLPKNQTGNSEAGHMNIGAGRIVLQDDIYITEAINNKTFFKNPAFLEAINNVHKHKSNIHLIGLLSGDQSAHVDPVHLQALLELLRRQKIKDIYLHLFTDGRDSSPRVGMRYLKELKSSFKNGEKIATITGRFYAMDRNKNWEKTELAYNAMVHGEGKKVDSAEEAIIQAYNRGESDEFILPTVIMSNGRPIVKIKNNDSIIFFNLRSDRARQLTKLFVQNNVCDMNNRCKINALKFKNLKFVSMTDFGPDLDKILTAFPSRDIESTLPMQLNDLRQLYLSESEKYAHVTYFFNGGYKDPVDGEVREMIPSPLVDSYAEAPQMSAEHVCDRLLECLNKDLFDFYVVNFANPDMVGHTGDLNAGIKSVEAVDKCLSRIYDVFEKKEDICILITADHGNVEEMINLKTGEVDTKHSCNKVPFIIIDKKLKNIKLKDGILADVAPTILDILNIKKPAIMTGKSLIYGK